MVHVSKLALSITLLLSVPSWAMEKTIHESFLEMVNEKRAENLSTEERKNLELNARFIGIFTKRYSDSKEQELKDISQPPTIKEPTEVPKNPVKFTKVPQPKHITLLSKEIATDKIAAFKAMMNTNPSIVVVKDLETLKNPDIKKIREVGNYTMFGDSQNHKWVVDNETGNDLAFSQEMIEKILQLDTEDIERMLKNDAFNEQSIDNNLEVMNKKQ